MSTRKVTVRAPARTGKRQASATGQKFLKRCCILLGGGSLPVFRTGGSFYSRQVIVELKSRNFGSQKIIPEIARRAAVSCLPGEADCSGRSLPGSGKKRYHPEMVPIPTRASGPYKCRASISLRATLIKTTNRLCGSFFCAPKMPHFQVVSTFCENPLANPATHPSPCTSLITHPHFSPSPIHSTTSAGTPRKK